MKKNSLNIEECRARLMFYFLKIDATVDKEELAELVKQFTPDFFEKKDIIIKAGDYGDHLYFIIKGMVRIYYIKEGKEITNWFITEDMIFAPTYSIYTGKKSYTTYEALEDTIVLKIKYSTLESFYYKYHSLEHMGRILIQLYYAAFIKKTYNVLSLSAEERYLLFINENRELLNRANLKHIATYLGITQETLSRLRAKY